jgi:hypothetical protein
VTDPSAPEERKPHPDPEVEALLQFEPVVRKCVRHDGWLADRQREFIIALTVLGHAEQAAIAVGGTMSGAYKLRTANGGEQFAGSWDAALALHHRRHPRPEPRGRPSRGEIESGTGRKPWPARGAPPPEPEPEPEPGEVSQFYEDVFALYQLKLREERKCRLEGRIAAADFAIRQATWLELVLCLGGKAMDVLKHIKAGDHELLRVVSNPMSELLGKVRRAYWLEKGEADRPPPPPLGRHDDRFATGPAASHRNEPGGPDLRTWGREQDEEARLAAEAQREWEEKAKAEAEAWAKREAAKDGPEAEGEEGRP